VVDIVVNKVGDYMIGRPEPPDAGELQPVPVTSTAEPAPPPSAEGA
jgi:hypothetical protein